jgi:hypothetical protein
LMTRTGFVITSLMSTTFACTTSTRVRVRRSSCSTGIRSLRTGLPTGVRSEPTPPPRPRLDVAPPAPGRLPADGPARVGQQPMVAPEIERVPFGTESLAISTSPTGSCFVCWSAMERRRPAPVRKGDALGAGAGGYWIPVRWDANSCWLIQPGSGPRPAGRGRRETARRREGTNPAGRPARSGPLGCTGKPWDRPPARLATRPTSGLTGPTRGPRGLPGRCYHAAPPPDP